MAEQNRLEKVGPLSSSLAATEARRSQQLLTAEQLADFFAVSLAVINGEGLSGARLPPEVESYLASSLAGFGSKEQTSTAEIEVGEEKAAQPARCGEAMLTGQETAAASASALALLLSPGGAERLRLRQLRHLGDEALFSCGFFSSHGRSSRGRPYYRLVGELSYSRAAQLCHGPRLGVELELAVSSPEGRLRTPSSAVQEGGAERQKEGEKRQIALSSSIFLFLSSSFLGAARILEDLADLSALIGGTLPEFNAARRQDENGIKDGEASRPGGQRQRQARLLCHYEALVAKRPVWRLGGDLLEVAERLAAHGAAAAKKILI